MSVNGIDLVSGFQVPKLDRLILKVRCFRREFKSARQAPLEVPAAFVGARQCFAIRRKSDRADAVLMHRNCARPFPNSIGGASPMNSDCAPFPFPRPQRAGAVQVPDVNLKCALLVGAVSLPDCQCQRLSIRRECESVHVPLVVVSTSHDLGGIIPNLPHMDLSPFHAGNQNCSIFSKCNVLLPADKILFSKSLFESSDIPDDQRTVACYGCQTVPIRRKVDGPNDG